VIEKFIILLENLTFRCIIYSLYLFCLGLRLVANMTTVVDVFEKPESAATVPVIVVCKSIVIVYLLMRNNNRDIYTNKLHNNILRSLQNEKCTLYFKVP